MIRCSCGSAVIEYDNSRGHSVCVSCGEVLEQNAIVSEVTFTDGGGAEGFFVSKSAARVSTKSGSRIGTIRTDSTENREQTIANGYARIQAIGPLLKITDRQIEAAQRYFNLAVLRISCFTLENFTKGRKGNVVACACLYIVCRVETTWHMLIDFAEHLRINLYVLGATFMKLVSTLKIHDMPVVDPMIYLVRFASRLEYFDKTPDVIRDATRLVSRMDRDWIIKGRKPSGICAACLFIASRMNGFNRTVREIVDVVKICEATLKNRLDDFKATPSSELSVDDFQTLMLEASADPPSFSRKRKNVEEIAPSDVHVFLESEEMKTVALNGFLCLYLAGFDISGIDEDLSVLDADAEICNFMLTEEEYQLKKSFWEAGFSRLIPENADWEKAKEAQAETKTLQKTKKPRKKKEAASTISGATAHQAGLKLLASKPSLSKKINYDIVESLFTDEIKQAEILDAARTGEYAVDSVTGFGRNSGISEM